MPNVTVQVSQTGNRQWPLNLPMHHELNWLILFGSVISRAAARPKADFKRVRCQHGLSPEVSLHLLNTEDASLPKRPQTRNQSSLYDDAARQAPIVLWEASDRVCGKRLQPLLRILLPSLERH